MDAAVENKKLMQDLFAAIAIGNRALFVDALAECDDADYRDVFVVAKLPRQSIAAQRSVKLSRNAVSESPANDPVSFYRGWRSRRNGGARRLMTKAGVPYRNDYCLVYRLENGKIVVADSDVVVVSARGHHLTKSGDGLFRRRL